METWVLVVFISAFSGVDATTVNGLTSYEACNQAGKMVTAIKTSSQTVNWICICTNVKNR